MSNEAVSGKLHSRNGAIIGSENSIADSLVQTLEQSDFFHQMNDLKDSLAGIAGELSSVGSNVNSRAQEVETMAAHIMAIESVLAVILKKIDIDPNDIKAEVSSRSAALSGNPEGSPTVQAIAADIISG